MREHDLFSRDLVPDDCPLLVPGKKFTSSMDSTFFGLDDFDPADQNELIEVIISYWKGNGNWEKTKNGLNFQVLPEHLRKLIYIDETVFPPRRSQIYTSASDTGHYGHNCIDYEEVLEKGFGG